MRSWSTQLQRIARTLRALWLEPGRLAQAHLHGSRVGFIPPWTLFINAVAVFFLFSAATQFQLTSMAEQDPAFLQPMVARQASARGLTPEVLLDRAERRFQAVYTLSLAIISGLGYMVVYRLLLGRSLGGWRGAFTLSLNYLAFLFTLFLPWMIAVTLLQRHYGKAFVYALLVGGLAIAVAWNAAAARRIAQHGWPMAIAKGVAVMLAGFVIDSLMTIVAVAVTLRIA